MKKNAVLASLLTLASALPAWAYPNSNVQTTANVGTNIHSPSPAIDSETLTSSSGAPLSSSSSRIASDPFWTLSAVSTASVQPGLIRLDAVSASHAIWNSSVPGFDFVAASAQTSSSARWADSFTIDGGTALNGTVGHLVAGFRVDGTLASSFDSSVGSSAVMDQQYGAWLRLTNTGTGQDVWAQGGQRHLVDWQGDRWLPATGVPERAPGLWTIAIDFKYGTPIQLDMRADIYSRASAFACSSSSCVTTSDISSTVDFGHTVFWDGFIGLTDAAGNSVSGYSVSSLSGFDYGNSAAPVPEPSVGLLLLAGLGLVGAIARRRRT